MFAEEDDGPPPAPKVVAKSAVRTKAQTGNLSNVTSTSKTTGTKTANSPPQNLQNPLQALFGGRMKTHRSK